MIKASRLFLTLAVVFLLVMPLLAQKNEGPPPGAHYNLNVIGFAQCEMKTPGVYPDCFNGNAGDIQTSGHTIFVPLRTLWIEDPCDTTDASYYGDAIEVAELQKGVRILVSDGPEMTVPDRDATDGLARFIVPYGQYEVWARPGGKPGGCMDIDTLMCSDIVTLAREDCDPALTGQQYVLVGHVDVDRTQGRQKWQNVTAEMLAVALDVTHQDYYDFFWQIYNNNLRLLQLRFYRIGD